ncbi:MAG: hypothetical protein HKO65_14950 [Gemmatimonadetes bacterium]|nr:hypothetical protein [Gemmatimonadota bacterium]NNM06388.1 hypothetical protein [Gemmatimonadota bacterium]
MNPLRVEAELLNRLADPADPALRPKVLTDLMDRGEDDPGVVAARDSVADRGWVKATLDAHHGDGTWGPSFSHGYRGTSWVLYHLSELGAPADVDGIQKGMEVLKAVAKSIEALRGRRALLFQGCTDGFYWTFPTACFSSRAATALIRYGHSSHPVTQGALSVCRTLFDPEEGFDCFVMDDSLLPSCFMSVPSVLKAFLAIPHEDRSDRDREFIEQMVRLVKKRHLYRYVAKDSREWQAWGNKATAQQRREESPIWLAAGRADPRREKVGWLRFGFPHHYNSDLLEVVLLLGEAGTAFDEVIEEGLGIILSKRGKDGMWKMAGGLNGKMHADLDEKGAPSPWITYRALLAFKRFGLLEVLPE